MKYANVIIDNKADSTDTPYTYGIPEGMGVSIGDRVLVPFARSRNLREGYVQSLQEDVSENLKGRIRSIDHVDDEVSLTEEMIRTAGWMRTRYVCRHIDAIRCFLPSGKRGKRAVHPEPVDNPEEEMAEQLTEEQTEVLDQVLAALDSGEHQRFLLHGVTGSGKTEVYIRATEKAVENGRTAIILVPEISLTPQIIRRFAGVFGQERIAVLHSRLTLRQRYEQWQKIRRGEIDIVIGARSAVFAPLENIGLIVLDEEHESTYKSDSTPKYDTVEVAIKRLKDEAHKGVLLLGSATPSVASFQRGQEGIYKILSMEKRYNETPLPQVKIIDMRKELREGNLSVLSRELCRRMEAHLEEGRQVMLFLNRRGYSTFISCRECGHVISCPTCGLSLTYHRSSRRLSCHYCGYEEELPEKCPECESRRIRYFGTGTEKVEETIREAFPGRTTDRIDLDSIRRKGELNRRLKAFARGETDILIGTQLIAKGLDFRNVGLVGIISADVTLNIPDFRSPERAFQLITQAAGRAGRGERQGEVVIQTYSPDHPAVIHAAAQDYQGFFAQETLFRQAMGYPPFGDMIQVLFSSEREAEARDGANHWYEQICRSLPEKERGNVFPPQEAYMHKIGERYRYSLVIRCPRGRRSQYTGILRALKEEDTKRRVRYLAVADVNPYSFA